MGQLEVWRAGQNEGLITHKAKKVWVIDGRPCDDCIEMDGEAVGLNDYWVMPSGKHVEIPTDSHPNCECGQSLDFG